MLEFAQRGGAGRVCARGARASHELWDSSATGEARSHLGCLRGLSTTAQAEAHAPAAPHLRARFRHPRALQRGDALRLAARGGRAARVARHRVSHALALGGGRLRRVLDAGRGELVYEHVLGHRHHDHMVCLGCGRIEEFRDDRIEQLQVEACKRKGFDLVNHSLVLQGYCRRCRREVGVERAPRTSRETRDRADHARPGTRGRRSAGPVGASYCSSRVMSLSMTHAAVSPSFM